MLITSILILGINAAHKQANLIFSVAESNRPIYHNARLITETFRSELSSLYFPKPAENQNIIPFELITLPGAACRLTFYTLTPCWSASSDASRIVKVRYSFTKDTDTEQTILKRFEQLYAAEKPIGKETSDVIIKGLSDFKLWVFDPNSDSSEHLWEQSCKLQHIPPKALKLQFKWPQPEKGPPVEFQTIISIPCRLPLEP